MTEITVIVPLDDADEIETQLRAQNADVLRTENQGFDGSTLVGIAVTLTPVLIRYLVKMYALRLDANKQIQFIADGIAIKGVSEQTLLKLMDRRNEDSKSP